MSLFETIVIAIVEGLTEFLPVSSTGHMIITQNLLGMENSDFLKAFTVNIQFGAILSVIVLYWKRFFQSWDFYWKLLIAFLPAAVIGLLAADYIDNLLENVWVVAIMLVVGGVFMLFVDKLFAETDDNQEIDWKRALKIGFFQCIAMIPGVSRSMATIVGGMSTKLSRKNAAEFSFFLAVPTMAAAAGYKLLKLVLDPAAATMLTDNLVTLLIGNVVAFIVAMAAIKFFIGFLTKHGFKAFGYYRIVVGGLIIVLLLLGRDLSIV
ncbi:MAG: undecaprenyl-diphosphate phosphatase [Paludibacter sp.]|jgi:undecaprenyl-diphosphatase|nr:undecaprenyl-diphosphate phosphatase [Bacteroidales bacterium]HOG05558.1 undecaprenyl-diphosphate phosphatase [Paludibacter sp.]HPM09219.1 undecaprenyl-diphosphate phosphatase [Paludibacter sp.]